MYPEDEIIASAQAELNRWTEFHPAESEEPTIEQPTEETNPLRVALIEESIIDEAVSSPQVTTSSTDSLATTNARYEDFLNTQRLEEEREDEENFEDEPEDSDSNTYTEEEENAVLTIPTETTEQPQQPQREEEFNNSESYKVKDNVSRFKGAPWFEIAKEQTITLAGIGGIGSFAAFLLSRVMPKAMAIYDGDTVEFANLSGQLYSSNDLDKSKVSAIANMIDKYALYKDVFTFNHYFTTESEATKIMISGFDNMNARKLYFAKWIEYVLNLPQEERKFCLFIDGRMAAESIQVFCFTGEDTALQEKYRKNWLFSSEEADVTVCSYKQTTYCAAMIGSIITNLFVNFCTNLSEPDFLRDLPFFTIYEANLMMLRKEYE